MANSETLKSLRERVLAASGAGDALDEAICISLQYGGKNSEGATSVRLEPDAEGWLLFEVGGEECCNRAPEVTASIDAALALFERMLPGWEWRIMSGGCRPGARAETLEVVGFRDDRIGRLFQQDARTAPLAILTVLLSALIARDEPTLKGAE